MKVVKSIATLLTVFAPLALAKDKKKDTLPALFSNARYVYVRAEDGDIMKPGLFPEDRDTIANVQDALKGWPCYSLTLNRNDADLIIIVRKGRLASAQVHGGSPLELRPESAVHIPIGIPAEPVTPIPTATPTAPIVATPSGPEAKLDHPTIYCVSFRFRQREN